LDETPQLERDEKQRSVANQRSLCMIARLILEAHELAPPVLDQSDSEFGFQGLRNEPCSHRSEEALELVSGLLHLFVARYKYSASLDTLYLHPCIDVEKLPK
jgi:hypothetical protein